MQAERKTDSEIIATTHNTARYFVESRHVAWILFFFVLLWGFYSYNVMNKRKDPLYSNLFACVVCPWPGASAEQVEQLVTRKLEEKISQNMKVVLIQSVSRANLALVTIKLDERLHNTANEFDDLALKLQSIHDLPSGAGPIEFLKDYGDVTNLMLTVASPKATGVEISLRAEAIKRAIDQVRPRSPPATPNVRESIIVCFPQTTPSAVPKRQRDLFAKYAAEHEFVEDIRPIDGNGFVGIDCASIHSDADTLRFISAFVRDKLKVSYLHPDLWNPAIVHDPAQSRERLTAVAGDKYSYKELSDYTDLIKRTLQALPQVTRITQAGNLGEQINLEYSQERLASYGIQPVDLRERLAARNMPAATGGVLEVEGKNLPVVPTGEFKSETDIGNVLIGTSDSGTPVYLRDVVDISRDYESPPRFLAFLTSKDEKGNWQRTRAVTMGIFMRTEEHIDAFGKAVNTALDSLKQRLPEDLILVRTADQPEQVEENVELFMTSLYEAIGLVVLTALIGFWEWRSALLIAISIPTTLAMTFGMMNLLGIDIQQCSIAALIISLGLLVDDPVVAGDAIKRALTEGHPPIVAAWLGPTKLAHAIMFATITNIAAYLPLLMISGEVGQFIASLPVVITCSLIASRLVSMTFVPLLGYYLLRPFPGAGGSESTEKPKKTAVEIYLKAGNWVLDHRILVFALSLLVLVGGVFSFTKIKQSFFPNDLFNLCWVDVWMPNDAPLSATNDAALHTERIIREVADLYAREHPDKQGKPHEILDSITTFLGGSGPRFWSSVLPELDQLNYAQVVIKLDDKHDTDPFIPKLQRALSLAVPEARCDVRQLEGGKPVGIPVSIRISGQDSTMLRKVAAQVAEMLRSCPLAERVRDDWGSEAFTVQLQVHADRANLAGLTNQDIADSSATGLNGAQVDTLREGDKQIPIVARMRAEESSQIQSINDLYVYSVSTKQKVPLPQIASIGYSMQPEKFRRRNQFRTITVAAFPIYSVLPSEVMEKIHPQLQKLESSLPPGYKIEIGGEEEEQTKSFAEMTVVMAVSIIGIFLCLVIQFKSAVKPLLVFSGIPYGMVGALVGLSIMDKPFGFPAFLGVASLAGVIVSHVIVLFDFIEAGREEGMPLRDALLHASMFRLRPVLITVAATVLGFIPLAAHGGPLWEPLCYAQIGGLTFATFVTLGLVPVIYAISVLDLKIIRWEE
jgi:multidrug efflux pump subunit AcrB